MSITTAQQDLIIKMTITAWDAQNKYLSKLLESLTDEQLQKEIAPGRNTGIYLLGHLIAVSDAMLPLLGFGERLFPALENVFVKNPDKSGLEMPSVSELKGNLDAVNAKLSSAFQSCTADEWLSRHTAVSAEDFVNELHRNKLNVVISRTNHMANHIGQMLLLK
ncbi:MAG: DinB family protein [Chitinophagaceae bacterium]|nr:DinB family protein [Chitinophagaceae bacterium]